MTTLTRLLSLESGDRLTRAEFHRRYCGRPDIKKAELVEGVVYVASPVRFSKHGAPHAAVVGILFAYVARHPGLAVLADNSTLLLDPDNEVQPDVMLFRAEAGAARENDAGYVEGAPDLVVEVAASSASYDLHDKKNAYRRAGVAEYVVWRVEDEVVDWFRLEEGVYVLAKPDGQGVIESLGFPGLRLAVPKLIAGDYAAALAAID
jgi:Uma2 family endonuclease